VAAPPTAPALPAITVAADAIVDRDGKTVVFEVLEGRARVRGVTPGGSREGRTVVREGLAGSETLVLRPPATLKDGDPVRTRG
jgi:hypothetical protein